MGTWDMVGLPGWLMVYNDDGTGHRGMVGGFEDFTWETSGDTLWQHFGGATGTELWGFVISDNVVTFSQGGVDQFWFTRVDEGAPPPTVPDVTIPDNAGHDPDLFGSWSWSDFDAWLMIYHGDGTGQRGMVGGFEEFTWGTLDGELWQDFGAYMEHYAYAIEDGVVTFNNLVTGEVFIFNYLPE
jgi:hypothetical protein